jgi:hypothetical protein
MHVKSQPPLAHTATPLAGGTHSSQAGPQFITLSAAKHAPSHALNPALQTKPHAPALHVAVAPAGAGHGVHPVPHVAGESLLAHAPLHS